MTLDDVRQLAVALPEVVEGERHGGIAWSVGGKVFAWERSFSKADVRRFGEQSPPPDPIVAIRTADLADKDAVLASGRPGVFTIPHFDGYAAVLLRLDDATAETVRDLLEDGWLSAAPPALAASLTARRSERPS